MVGLVARADDDGLPPDEGRSLSGDRSSLIPPLGRRTWVLVLANCVSNVGSGLTLPFLIVYLHAARGIPLTRAGLLLALAGAAGIATTPMAGELADRIGARRTFVIGELLFTAATAWFIPVASFAAALGPTLIFGAAGGLTWSGLFAMLGEGAPAAHRNEAFGISYALANIGVGIGALIGGSLVDAHSPNSFIGLFAGDATSNLLFAVVLISMGDVPVEVGPGAPADASSSTVERRYRQVISDTALLGAVVLNTVLVTFGASQLTSGFPAWVTGPAGSTPAVVGAGFAVNAVTLVTSQLFVLRAIRGRRRTGVAASGAVIFSFAWVIVLLGGRLEGGLVSVTLLVAGPGIVALGEALLSPSLPALINGLAPPALRERYNAVFTLSWQIGAVIGPGLAGSMLGRGYGSAFLLVLALGCVVGAVGARGLERVVPLSIDRSPR
jgi:MFS family permease